MPNKYIIELNELFSTTKRLKKNDYMFQYFEYSELNGSEN
jgi:hypothetical protein